MYAQDFHKENGTKDAVGPYKQRASQRRQDDDSLGSEWVGAIRYKGTEHPGVLSGSDPLS